MDESQFFHGLLQGFPQLEDLHARHVEFYEERLSHVLLAGVVRWAVGLLSEAGQRSAEEITVLRLTNFIERAYVQGDDEVKELIRFSFVENLPYLGEDGYRICECLTGNLLKMLMER
ncbi:DUF7674 family protein [Streptomyces lonarensis]|uniref:DUF7674 domain-containing protein n=1 Tax=Streptomyces lonarensis TaxID=700599 RepID=A0A7X6CY63_9ACTN|nr:hypothetical protein [Streptomyces lonarensis]NJQ04583.1 hypothetical protein [Streptomyces lonarensis]